MSGFQPWQNTGRTKHSVARQTGCLHGHSHHSKREANRCNILHEWQRLGHIVDLRTQHFFPFVIDGSVVKLGNGHDAGWKLDFSYVDRTGRQIVEDVKGNSRKSDSADIPLRKAIFKHLYPDWQLKEIRR